MKRRKPKHLCSNCNERPALFFSPARHKLVAKDDGHDLCRQCYQSLLDSTWPKPPEPIRYFARDKDGRTIMSETVP